MKEELWRYMMKIIVATVVMAVVVLLIWKHSAAMKELGRIIWAGFGGAVTYLAMCFVLKVDQAVSILKRWKFAKG